MMVLYALNSRDSLTDEDIACDDPRNSNERSCCILCCAIELLRERQSPKRALGQYSRFLIVRWTPQLGQRRG